MVEQGPGYFILVNAAGLLILAGWVSLLYNLISRQISSRRRLSSLLGLVLLSLLGGIYINFITMEFLEGGFVGPVIVRWSFVLSYLILGCLFVLVPWIDRKEYREFVKPAERLAETVHETLVQTGFDSGGEEADGSD